MALIFAIIHQSTGSVSLSCYFVTNYEGSLGNINYSYQYKCYGVIDLIEDGSWDIDMVFGKHEFNKTLESVKFLEIQDENLFFIPPNLSLFFPNLIGLVIGNSKLQSLQSQDLKPFYNLSLLRIFKNPLTTLNADTFRYNPNLQVIDMSLE